MRMNEELNRLLDEYAFQILDKGGLVSNDFTIDIMKAKQAIIDYVNKDYNNALREGHNQGYQEGYCDAEKDIGQAMREEEAYRAWKEIQ